MLPSFPGRFLSVPIGIFKNIFLKDIFSGTLSIQYFKEFQAGEQDLSSRHMSKDGPSMHSGLHFSICKMGVRN